MAEEAFALSPISARATLPGDEDYEAIREAFMETSRGRWFLAEYTKRNRNADTSLVLEAVSRMEASLAAQKQASSAPGLIEALGAIRAAIREAKVRAAEAMPRIDDNEILGVARSGARIIREIAWTLRECGADTRICDLLDTHIKAVETAQQMIATGDSRGTVLASFDVLVQKIEQLAADSAKSSPSTSAAAAPEPATETTAEKREASVTPLFRPAPEPVVEAKVNAVADVAAAIDDVVEAMPDAQAAAEIAEARETLAYAEQAEEASDKIATALAEILLGTSDATAAAGADAVALDPETVEDLAVLDMVAMEMAAPDLDEPEHAEAEAETESLASVAVEPPAVVAPAAIIADLEAAGSAITKAFATEPTVPEVAKVPAPQVAAVSSPSLGDALIATGLIANPAAPKADPLAAIRRMTQIEKIAFFS